MPSLLDAVEYEGFWWLLNDPDNQVSGKLCYFPNGGIRLNLLLKSEVYYSLFENFTDPEIIQGYVLNQGSYINHITLVYCYRSGDFSSTSDGLVKIEYSAQLAIFGAHYKNLDEIIIKTLTVYYTYLEDWLRLDNLIFDTRRQILGDEVSVETKYERKKPLEIRLDVISSTIYCCSDIEDTTATNEINWKESAYIDIRPDSSQSLIWYFEKTVHMRNLLAFLSGVPIYQIRLHALVTENGVPNMLSIILPVNYPQYLFDSVIKPFMTLTTEVLGQQIGSIFQAWFRRYEELGTSLELALGVLYSNHMFTKFEFLALMQSLESYHRVLNPNCQRAYQDKFGQSQIRECHLIERLEELYSELPIELKWQIGINDSSLTLKSLVQTRNFYTHYGDRKGDVLDGVDLHNAVAVIARFFAILIFYKELDIPVDQIKEAFLTSRPYGFWGKRFF